MWGGCEAERKAKFERGKNKELEDQKQLVNGMLVSNVFEGRGLRIPFPDERTKGRSKRKGATMEIKKGISTKKEWTARARQFQI